MHPKFIVRAFSYLPCYFDSHLRFPPALRIDRDVRTGNGLHLLGVFLTSDCIHNCNFLRRWPFRVLRFAIFLLRGTQRILLGSSSFLSGV